jgi:hypothetical protein
VVLLTATSLAVSLNTVSLLMEEAVVVRRRAKRVVVLERRIF